MAAETQVQVLVDGRLGRITLDRPRAINALTLGMVEEIDAALDRLLDEPGVETVVIDGAGERGLCAGGDMVAVRESAFADGTAARRFWHAEYRLNARIASFPKPVVAIMDGIVMGGGVGLAGHATYRVATETLVWAMPEVLIGFAPDVGGTWLLSRLPGEAGTWLALTAHRVDAPTALVLGLADVVVPRAEIDQVLSDLAVADPATVLGGVEIESRSATAVPPALTELIDECFAGDEVETIEAALEQHGGEEAETILAALRRGSPTSLKVTLAALRAARDLPTLEACLEAEYRTSCALLGTADLREGIRAVLVDKDGEPRWDPPAPGRVDPATVAAILAGPQDLEPLWPDAEREGR